MNGIKSSWKLLPFLIIVACNNNSNKANEQASSDSLNKGTYAYDVQFLKKYSHNLIELSSDDGQARVLVSGDYQGRVMTSTANKDSYGWINYDLISSKQKRKQFNPVGGEERFWMGPEGGQYSIYFSPGDSFTINKWQVPSIIDTVSYDLVTQSKSHAEFTKRGSLINYSGTKFDIEIDRSILLMTNDEISKALGTPIDAHVNKIGFLTATSITNIGMKDWKKESGLLSIWLLGMFTPTPETVTIIPFHPAADARKNITDNYFGAIPPDRLIVHDSVLFFTCDGKHRSKIGLSPSIAKPIAGSFDFSRNILTIVIPQVNPNGSYVNSKWEIQKEPYNGDVINAYNDGPLTDGSQLGPFYEIESSSSTKELKKGQQLGYRQITCHFQGDYEMLRSIAEQLLTVDLDEVRKHLK